MEKEYKCGFCKTVFKQDVMKEESIKGKDGMKGIKGYSSQVRCYACGNFLKTWGD